jgi:hypothetical protein
MAAVMDKPWYRHYWVWIVLAPLIATVVASFVTLYLAGAPPALVVDDFGQIAMAIEQDQARDRRAAELRVAASVVVDAGGEVTVRLAGAAPPRLALELVHPTLEALDRSVMLARDGDAYRGRIERPDARLYLQLTDDAGEWRLTGELPRGTTAAELGAGP